jgi:aerotaxis receptor
MTDTFSTHSNVHAISGEYEIGDGELLVLVSNKAGNFVYANQAYLKASGYTWDELNGTLTTRMLHKDTPVQVSIDMVTMLRSKQPWTGIIKNKRKNGEYYWLRLNLSPLFANGQYAGGLLVHSKVTREEIRHIEPLYKMMSSGQHKDLIMSNGQPLRLNLAGKLRLFFRRFGLNTQIWGGVGVLNAVGLLSLLAVGDPQTLTWWLSLCGFAGVTSALGFYLSASIVAPLRKAMRFANDMAAGDLSAQLSSARSDEIGGVLRALAQMSVNMRATVQDVRDGVSHMRQSTDAIADGTVDLSGRTNQQAAQLETTAASMEEMHATVKQTADTSKQATKCAADAYSAAASGGKVIAEVVSTMAGITQSSKKIAEIVGVIDSIAFQTNILALNAAVEAARAGEQGRGFAVVAAEVRNLAQRSAQSAREIRELIFASVEKVDGGAKLVDSAGKTVQNVVTQVHQLSELVNRIAAAALEQSAGIGQINDGVTALDEVTQQNAAMVDEHTASAVSLRAEAVRLAEAVSVFKLSQKENVEFFHSTKVNAEDVRQATLTVRAA